MAQRVAVSLQWLLLNSECLVVRGAGYISSTQLGDPRDPEAKDGGLVFTILLSRTRRGGDTGLARRSCLLVIGNHMVTNLGKRLPNFTSLGSHFTFFHQLPCKFDTIFFHKQSSIIQPYQQPLCILCNTCNVCKNLNTIHNTTQELQHISQS